MIEINKNIGKVINSITPEFISVTSHKRHYYLVECDEAQRLYEKVCKDVNEK